MPDLEDLKAELTLRIKRLNELGWDWTAEERHQLEERIEDVFAEIVKTAGDLAVERYRLERGKVDVVP